MKFDEFESQSSKAWKQRIQYAVGRTFSNDGNGVSPIINVAAFLIFIAFIIMMLDQ